jgi:NADPH:quinone reductase-like Zn-dependent oxidoreductase
MYAAAFDTHGPADVIVWREVPTPEPAAGEVRIRVGACALNHLDLFVRRGIPGVPTALPHVGGSDVAGTIDAVGAGVSSWSIGDRVIVNPALWCGQCESCVRGEHSLCREFRILGEHTWGGFAELVVAPARNLLRLPEAFSFTDAAAVPLTFQTAYRALFTQGRLRIGETLLVLGASGGVAVAAIQMAKVAGAFVYAVTSGEERVRRVRQLGADVALDRTRVSFSKEIWQLTGKRGVDVVLENVGQATWKDSLRCLARGGRLVTYGATSGPKAETDVNLLFWKQVSLIGTTMATHAEFLRSMDLFLAARVKPIVSHVLPLQAASAAHEILERGEQFGKVVLQAGA